MAFADLKQLEEHLATRSYIQGYACVSLTPFRLVLPQVT